MTPGSTTFPSPREFALSIVRTLQDAGHIAYFAGGCVRDELLGLAPKDFDVATDAVPQRIAALFPHTQEVGARFGVMIVKSRGQMIEVATFRSDGPYSDRRRPDGVTFSDPQTDAARRDFTINALFLDPLATSDPTLTVGAITPRGRLIDFVNGVDDIQNGILRAVGDADARFKEDDLRVLRAIRFAARFGLSIEPSTSQAIRRHAGELSGISRERVGEEVRRMLAHPTRAQAASLLSTHGLLGPTLGGVTNLTHHTRINFPVLASIASDRFGTLLAALLTDLGLSVQLRDMFAPKPRTDTFPQTEIATRLRAALTLSNDEFYDFLNTIDGATAVRSTWNQHPITKQKLLAQTPWFSQALALIRAQDAAAAAQLDADLAKLAATTGGICPNHLVTGEDLNALGFKPGPRFKQVLDQVYDAQLSGEITTRTEALELVRRLCV